MMGPQNPTSAVIWSRLSLFSMAAQIFTRRVLHVFRFFGIVVTPGEQLAWRQIETHRWPIFSPNRLDLSLSC
jgi:hypothetical protein